MATHDDGATGVDTLFLMVNPLAISTLTLQPTNNPTETQIAVLTSTDRSPTGSPDLPNRSMNNWWAAFKRQISFKI